MVIIRVTRRNYRGLMSDGYLGTTYDGMEPHEGPDVFVTGDINKARRFASPGDAAGLWFEGSKLEWPGHFEIIPAPPTDEPTPWAS